MVSFVGYWGDESGDEEMRCGMRWEILSGDCVGGATHGGKLDLLRGGDGGRLLGRRGGLWFALWGSGSGMPCSNLSEVGRRGCYRYSIVVV